MKLRLISSLKLAIPSLLTITSAIQTHAMESSESYIIKYIENEEDIIDYSCNAETDRYIFYLSSSLSFSPTIISSWSASAPLVTGGSLVFTSEDENMPIAVCFQNGESTVFEQPSYLSFESLQKLSFCNQVVSSNGSAINMGVYGKLYITGTKNTENMYDSPDVLFSGNKTSSDSGGAIFSGYDESSVIELSNNGNIEFTGNSVQSASYAAYGGAIYSENELRIKYNDGNILFLNNMATAIPTLQSSYGGAIYGYNVDISYNTGNVTFDSNEVKSTYTSSFGGAIQANNTLCISHNEGAVTFSDNSCISGSDATGEDHSYGGAIYGFNGVSITHNEGGVFFRNNTTTATYYAKGGAICGGLNVSQNHNGISFENNSSTSSNSFGESQAYGGAICGGLAALYNTGEIKFSYNVAQATCSGGYHRAFARAYGGAVDGGAAILHHTGNICFNNNSVIASTSSKSPYATYSYGGAINGGTEICYNSGNVCISENCSFSNSNYSTYSYGGFIYAEADISISHNKGNVTFLNNMTSATTSATDEQFAYSSSAYGGAISGYSGCTIDISHNTGDVLFLQNSVSASSSTAVSSACGGAIYTDGNLSIVGNGNVTFAKNYEKNGDSYQLRSIYIDSSSYANSFNLATNEGSDITFYDSIYVGTNVSVNFNADYEDNNGTLHKSSGDIIFTGSTTVSDLYTIKGEIHGTQKEVLASRTSEINTMTNLHGGTLRVEDGAIFESSGITVHENAYATVSVKNATLNVDGYALTLHAGNTLEIDDVSLILGDVVMMSSSILSLDSYATISGNLTLGFNLELEGNILNQILNLREGEQITLISGLKSVCIQDSNSINSIEYNTDVDDWTVDAANCFINLAEIPELKLHFDSHSGNLRVFNTYIAPEPSSVMLALFALTGLAARRRRK